MRLAKPSTYTPFIRRFTDERAKDLADTIALHRRVTGQWRASVWAKPDAAVNVAGNLAPM